MFLSRHRPLNKYGLIPVELKGDELCLKHRVSRIDGSYLMVNYPIGQLIIKFQE